MLSWPNKPNWKWGEEKESREELPEHLWIHCWPQRGKLGSRWILKTNRLLCLLFLLGLRNPDEQWLSGTGLLGGKQWKMATLDAEGQKSILADTWRWIMTNLPWERQILFYQPSSWTSVSLNPLYPRGLRCRYLYPNTWGHICNKWQSWPSFCLVLAACFFSTIW